MVLKALLAAVAVAAVGVGMVLPAPNHARIGFSAPRSQIAQIDVAR